MANFELAFEKLMEFEDSHPVSGKVTHDTGGQTRFGISENANQMSDNFWTDPPDEAINLAKAVYLQKYWKFGGIQAQGVANKVFDLYVNMGSNGIKLVQRCCSIEQDGKYGPETEKAINKQDQMFILYDLRYEASEFYRKLAEKNPDKYSAYLRGWLRRAAA